MYVVNPLLIIITLLTSSTSSNYAITPQYFIYFEGPLMLHYMYNRYMKLSNDTEALKACTYIPSLAAAVDYIVLLSY